MNWMKLLSALIIILLYVPMVFLGANVFFPQYTGSDSYYTGTDCYGKYPYPVSEKTTPAEASAVTEKQQACNEEYQNALKAWETEKNAYEGKKYVFVTLFNLIVLLGALLIPLLQDSVILGLFLGSTISTFAATLRFFNTNSRVGFMLLVVTFIIVLFFVNRKKESFMDWKRKAAS